MHAPDIVHRIAQTFNLAQDPPSVVAEDGYLNDQLVGLRWQDMDPNEIYLHSEALYTFTPGAFQYFLPAFMLPVLTDPDDSYELADEILNSLSSIQEYPSRLSLLSEEQKTTIAIFIEWCVTCHPEYFMQGTVGKKLRLCQFWSPFLPPSRSLLRSESEAEFFSEPAVALLDAYHRTFAGTPLPSGPLSPDSSIDSVFRSMEGECLAIGFLNRHKEAVGLLTKEGHRYLLPRCICACFDSYIQSADLVASLLDALYPWPRGVVTPFQDTEREMIARFVRWALAHRPEPHKGYLADKRVLCETWGSYLPSGMRMDFLDPDRDSA